MKEEKYRGLDPHVTAIIASAKVAKELTALLPQTDIIIELHSLLCIQEDILDYIVCSKDYGKDSLSEFHLHISDLNDEIHRINNANKKAI